MLQFWGQGNNMGGFTQKVMLLSIGGGFTVKNIFISDSKENGMRMRKLISRRIIENGFRNEYYAT